MYTQKQTVVSAQFDMNTAADKATIRPPFNKQKISKVWITGESADTGGATIKFDIRPTAGSDTSRGDGDAGVITYPAASQSGKRLFERPASTLLITAGQEIVVEVTSEGVSSSAFVSAGVEFEMVPETEANVATMVAA